MNSNVAPLALTPEFSQLLGQFHTLFSFMNTQVDMAIGQLLGINHEQTHLMTAGLMFGPKARLLADLIGRSCHPEKAKIQETLGRLRGSTKREVIAHGYIHSDKEIVEFIDRVVSGEFRVRIYKFTLEEFRSHVAAFLTDVSKFHSAMGFTDADARAFSLAAFNLERKSATSPQSPPPKAL